MNIMDEYMERLYMQSKELVYIEMWEVSCGVKAGLVVSLSYIYSAGRTRLRRSGRMDTIRYGDDEIMALIYHIYIHVVHRLVLTVYRISLLMRNWVL